MRKVRNLIIQSAAFLSIYALTAFNTAYGQLNVFILNGEEAVTEVQACQGTTVALTVEVSGGTGTGLTYTWTGDTNPLYFVDLGDLVSYKNNTPAGTYNLTVNVQDDGGFTGSASITVIILSSPSATAVANGVTTFCEGNSVELEETNGQAGVIYQWQRNYSNIPGASSSTYNAIQGGGYRVKVTNESNGCYRYSNPSITVTVNSLPAVTANNNGPVCYDETINLTSGPDGMDTYSWTSTAIESFTSPLQNPTITNATPDNSGVYTITVEDNNGCQNSTTTTVIVYADMDGGTIGSDQSICYSGDPVELTDDESPSGGDGSWTYSWESKVGIGAWTTIDGATTLTFDPPAGLTQTTKYQRVATNGCGIVYSNSITVTVSAQVDGGLIESDQTICYNGDPVIFTDDESPSGGNGAWTYSWESKSGSDPWITIGGAAALDYNAPSGLTQTTLYRRLATNSCGSDYSDTVTVTVNPVMNGGTISADQAICFNGDPAEFEDDLSPSGGAGGWTYSWESKVGSNPWSAIGGASNLTYDIPAGLNQTTSYQRVATNSCGTVYSNQLVVTVYPEMQGGSIDGNQAQCYNSDPSEITNNTPPTGGNGTWTYSWEYQSNCAGAWNTIAGATDLSYDPPANQTETRCYQRRATNDCGEVVSNTITKTIYANINGGTILDDQTVCNGGNPVAFTQDILPSGGTGAWSYTWESKVGAGNWGTITGATAATYDVPSGITQTTSYQRKATNSCGTGNSNALTITVSNAIDGGTIGSDQNICYNGDPVEFTDEESPSGGSGTWVYSWESKVGAGAWTPIPGTNSLTYNVPVGLIQTTSYHRVATNDCGTATSNDITLTVYADQSGGTIAGDQDLCYGGDPTTITTVLPPTGGPGTYTISWEYQSDCAGAWITIPGETDLEYDPPVQTENRCFRRAATSSCGTDYSNIITITTSTEIVFGAPAITNVTGCFGNNNGAISILASGGTPSYTYNLYRSGTYITSQTKAAGIAANFTSLIASTEYEVVVTDANSCVSESSGFITVSQPTQVTFTYTTKNLDCHGDHSGEIHFSASGGTPPYQYSINNGSTWSGSPDFAGLSAQNYSLKVRDANLCTTVRQVATLTQPAQLVSNGGTWSDVTTCYGDNTGSITVVASGGTPPYQYSIDAGANWQPDGTFEGLYAGTYTIMVEDAIGCSINVGPITINQPDEIDILLDVTHVTICWYNTNGEIFVWASGGTGNLQFSKDGGTTWQDDPLFDNLGVGPYPIMVKDENDCIVSGGTVNITGPPEILISSLTIDDVTCYGGSNGEIHATATGGTPALEYSLDGINYQATGDFTPLFADDYTLYVQDVNSCVLTQTVTVDQPDPLIFTTRTKTDITCNGLTDGTITLVASGGTPAYNYSITGGAPFANTTGIFTSLVADVYTPAVRDANGCITTAPTLTIIDPPVITITAQSFQDLLCFGDESGSITVDATGGTSPLVYELYNATHTLISTSSDGDFTAVPIGTYTVEVSDVNSCGPVIAGPFTLTQPPLLAITGQTSSDITCHDADDGTITIVTSGGTAPIVYNLRDAGGALLLTQNDNGSFSGLAEGTYQVEVTDANGCGPLTAGPFTIVNPETMVITTEAATDMSCNGVSDGTITVTVSGGTAPLTYTLYNSVPAVVSSNGTGIFNGLPADAYTVQISDATGCPPVVSSVLTVNNPSSLSITSSVVTNISCFGVIDGEIEVVATGGNLPYTFTLYDAAMAVVSSNSDGQFAGLSAGNYTVDVNDGNSCGAVSTGVLTVVEPAVLSTNIFKLDLSCNGDLSGEILIVASGGTAPYEYSFDGGTTFVSDNHATGLDGGDYTVITRDSRGCEKTDLVSLTEPEVLKLSLTGFDVSCSGVLPGDGRIFATSTGGTSSSGMPKLYRLDGGSWHTSGIFNSVSAGLHTVEVIDAKGCVETETITINEPTPITINSTGSTNPTCNTFGTITVSASGGTGTLQYILNPGGATNTTGSFTGLGAGDYTVSVTDDNDCGPVTTATISLVSPSPISIDDIQITHVTGCFGELNGEITIVASGGTGTLTYSIDGGINTQMTNTFTGLGAGNYQVVVNDDANCPEGQPVSVNEPAEVVITNVLSTHVTAPGANDGTIIVVATGGTGQLTYTLQPDNVSNTTGEFQGLAPGTYWVVVADDNGCSASTSPIQLSQIELTLTPTQITCFDSDNGSIVLTINGGTAPYTITWSGSSGALPQFDNLTVITGLEPGTYIANVTDAIGATGTNFVDITEPTAVSSSLVLPTSPSCSGIIDGSILVEGSGGTPAYTYTLYDAGMNQLYQNLTGYFTGLAPANYNLGITDSHGCTYQTTTTISDPLPISITTIDVDHPSSGTASDGSITISASGGTGTLSYTLLPNSITNTTGIFTGLPAGSYTVKIEDVNLCSITSSTIILSAMTVTVTPYAVSCNGGNDGWIDIAVNDFVVPLTIEIIWITPGGDIVVPDQNDLVAGTYRVNVSDGSGNMITNTTIITEPPVLTATIASITEPACFGTNNGSVEFTIAGGNPGYTIDWTGNSVSGTIAQPIAAGTYDFTITDTKGCTVNVLGVFVDEPAPLILSVDAVVHPSSAIGSDGTISVSTTGGTGIVTYTISTCDSNPIPPSTTTLTLQPNAADGKDAFLHGLPSEANVNYGDNPQFLASSWTIDFEEFLVRSIIDFDLSSIPSGATITGASLSLYAWADVSGSGMHSTISGPNDCWLERITTSWDEMTVTWTSQPATTTLNRVSLPASTSDDQDYLDIDVTQLIQDIYADPANSFGLMLKIKNEAEYRKMNFCSSDYINPTRRPKLVVTYTTAVTPSNTTGVFSNLPSGCYNITGVDENGCSVTSPDIVLSGMTLTVTPYPVSCNGGSDGYIEVLIEGGLQPFDTTCTKLLTTGNILMPGLTDLTAGDYLVVVTNAAGNIVSSQVTVIEPELLVAAFTESHDPICYGSATGTVTFDITGGNSPYTITWDGGTSAGNIAIGVTAGVHTFTINDSKGCEYVFPSTIELFDPENISITQLTPFDPLCNGEPSGKIILSAEGGTGILTYGIVGPINESNTSGLFEGLLAGIYDITITDENGCNAITEEPLRLILGEPTPIIISVLIPEIPLTCPNVPEGYAHLEVTGGTPDYQYLWSNLNTTPNLDGVVCGTYTVKITDAHGCIETKDVVIPGPAMLVPNVQITTAQCYEMKVTGTETGQVEIISTTGGTGDYNNFTYLWEYNSTTGPILTNVSSGDYLVTITDEAGCVYDFTYNVPYEPANYMYANALKDSTICYGADLMLTAQHNGPEENTYTYKWSEIVSPNLRMLGESRFQLVNPKFTTDYFLEIWNEAGCYSWDTVTVGVYPEIDVHVPQYVSAVKDSFIYVLGNQTYNFDVNTANFEYSTTFKLEPSILFTPSDSWNSSVFLDQSIQDQIPENLIVNMKDPDSKRLTDFIRVYAIATTEVGCVDTLRLYARMVTNLYFGNVFSPNNDGLNDLWVVPKDYLFPDLEIKIFNRWGSLVWSARGSKAAQGWDGKTDGGRELPTGTYYYVITFNAKSSDKNWKPITGSVTIVR